MQPLSYDYLDYAASFNTKDFIGGIVGISGSTLRIIAPERVINNHKTISMENYLINLPSTWVIRQGGWSCTKIPRISSSLNQIIGHIVTRNVKKRNWNCLVKIQTPWMFPIVKLVSMLQCTNGLHVADSLIPKPYQPSSCMSLKIMSMLYQSRSYRSQVMRNNIYVSERWRIYSTNPTDNLVKGISIPSR